MSEDNSIREWEQLPKNLGVLPALLGGSSKINCRASHWTGAAWTESPEHPYLVISPKFDFLKAGLMLAEVLASRTKLAISTADETGKVLDKGILAFRAEGDDKGILLQFDPSGKQIELPQAKPAEDFLLVQVVAFVNVISDLLERRRRVDRTPLQRSFNGQIRGRINIAKSVQRHWGAGEPHKVVCDITEVSANIPLNQVLMEALSRSSAYLAKAEGGKEVFDRIEHKIRRTRSHLHGVERLADTSRRKLAMIRNSLRGYYAVFRPVFDLACCIIRNDRFVIQPADGEKELSMTVPFGVNMNALFELYIRACVENIPEVSLEPVENRSVWKCTSPGRETLPKRRPDIVGAIDKRGFIIEVKYYGKDWLETLQSDEKEVIEGHARPREGFFQIVSYMHLFGAELGVIVFPSNKEDDITEGLLGVGGFSAGNLSFVPVGANYKTKLQDNLQSALGALRQRCCIASISSGS